jgi:hypothetical protein
MGVLNYPCKSTDSTTLRVSTTSKPKAILVEPCISRDNPVRVAKGDGEAASAPAEREIIRRLKILWI